MNGAKEDWLYQVIGEKIKQSRINAGLNQSHLASKISLSRTSMVNIEQGRQHASLHLLWKIAENLNVELRDLLPLQSDIKRVGAAFIDVSKVRGTANEGVYNLVTDFVNAVKSQNNEL